MFPGDRQDVLPGTPSYRPGHQLSIAAVRLFERKEIRVARRGDGAFEASEKDQRQMGSGFLVELQSLACKLLHGAVHKIPQSPDSR